MYAPCSGPSIWLPIYLTRWVHASPSLAIDPSQRKYMSMRKKLHTDTFHGDPRSPSESSDARPQRVDDYSASSSRNFCISSLHDTCHTLMGSPAHSQRRAFTADLLDALSTGIKAKYPAHLVDAQYADETDADRREAVEELLEECRKDLQGVTHHRQGQVGSLQLYRDTCKHALEWLTYVPLSSARLPTAKRCRHSCAPTMPHFALSAMPRRWRRRASIPLSSTCLGAYMLGGRSLFGWRTSSAQRSTWL